MKKEDYLRLENNHPFKSSFAWRGTSAQSSTWLIVPVIGAMLSAMGIWMYWENETLFTANGLLPISLFVLFVTFFMLYYKKALKKVKENIHAYPVVAAAIVMGNEAKKSYYYIYTQGSKRHDHDFIVKIRDNILSKQNNPKLQKKINQLFAPRMEVMMDRKKKMPLPQELSEGEKVWIHYVNLLAIHSNEMEAIEKNDRVIPLVIFSEWQRPYMNQWHLAVQGKLNIGS